MWWKQGLQFERYVSVIACEVIDRTSEISKQIICYRPAPASCDTMELLSACSIDVLSVGVLWANVGVVFAVWAMHVPFLTIQKSDP